MTVLAALVAASPAAADGVAPTIQCYTRDSQSGLVTIAWGYVNTTTSSITIPVGADNFFDPPPASQGQPTTFSPGVNTNVFHTTFDPSVLTSTMWFLDGFIATFSWPNTTYPVCGGAGQGPAGPQGPPGQNGNTILSGAGAPSDTLGNDGDWYIDTSTHTMYGPKTAGHWPATGFSLVGPQGATGRQGATGPQGSTGPQGPRGPQGPPGVPVCRNTIAAKVLCSTLFVPGTWVVGGGSVHGDFALARRHTVYARGSSAHVRQGRRFTFSMRTLRRVTPGHYTLTIRLRSNNFRLSAQRSVTIR